MSIFSRSSKKAVIDSIKIAGAAVGAAYALSEATSSYGELQEARKANKALGEALARREFDARLAEAKKEAKAREASLAAQKAEIAARIRARTAPKVEAPKAVAPTEDTVLRTAIATQLAELEDLARRMSLAKAGQVTEARPVAVTVEADGFAVSEEVLAHQRKNLKQLKAMRAEIAAELAEIEKLNAQVAAAKQATAPTSTLVVTPEAIPSMVEAARARKSGKPTPRPTSTPAAQA